ncbi:MAG: AI-2E family transporter [Gemmatimonadaceae bacterium]
MAEADESEPVQAAAATDRRRVERRANSRVADVTLPEFRKIVITALFFVIVVGLFVWMVRTVIIGAILGVIIAVYMRPLYKRLAKTLHSSAAGAIVALSVVIIPVVAAVVYSYIEVRAVVEYIATHQDEIVVQIDNALRGYPFVPEEGITAQIRDWVVRAADYGSEIPDMLQDALVQFAISTTIFIFTAFYVLTDAKRIGSYLRVKIPPRYAELGATLRRNVGGVLYGAIYATLLTQLIKSVIILALNLIFSVPLAVVLALISFIIGFFPIVGSWSVYVPVALWLLIFRDSPVAASLMVIAGFVINTVLLSTFLRPKLAAEKSKVLNFYWMFVGLVTGVYTFGIAGILIGPILIGLLKAVVDTLTASASWRLLDDPDALEAEASSPSAAEAPA